MASQCSAPIEGHKEESARLACPAHGATSHRRTGDSGVLSAPPQMARPKSKQQQMDAILDSADEEILQVRDRYAAGSEERVTRTTVRATMLAVEAACVDFESIGWDWCGDPDAPDAAGDATVKCPCDSQVCHLDDFEEAHGVDPGTVSDSLGGITMGVLAGMSPELGLRDEGLGRGYVLERDVQAARETGIDARNSEALAQVRGIKLSELSPDHPSVVLATAAHQDM